MARKGTDLLEGALRDLFGELDAERWDHVAENLDPDVELADEITGEWLRGSHRVGAYLRAQRGIVTEVRSTIGSVSTSRLADGLGLVTFTAGQRYRLGGAPRSETLSGSAIFAVNERGWKLRLLHLGEPSGADEVESAVLDAGRSARPGATLGESVRRVRATR
ncbi:MAG: hypothetical protein ABI595_07455, partial [Actinomycetota bacterium]